LLFAMNGCNNKRLNQIHLFACTPAQGSIMPAYFPDVLQASFLNNILPHRNLFYHTITCQYYPVPTADLFSVPSLSNNRPWQNHIFSNREKQARGYWLHKGYPDLHS